MDLFLNLINPGPLLYRNMVLNCPPLTLQGYLQGANAVYDKLGNYVSSDVAFDSQGWPLSLTGSQKVVMCLTDSNTDYHLPPGPYLLQADGTGTIQPLQFNGLFGPSFSFTGGTKSYVVNFTPAAGVDHIPNVNLQLSASPASDPLRNVKLMLPNPATGQPYDPADASSLYYQPWLDYAGGFLGYRLMDWLGVIGDPTTDFAQVASTTNADLSPSNSVGYAGVRGAVPFVVICQMIEQLGKSPASYWNIPVGATDDYLVKLFTLLRDKLTGPVFAEYTNEPWDDFSPVQGMLYQLAIPMLGTTTDDGVKLHNAVKYCCYRTKQIADIGATVFAATGQLARFKPVLTANQTQQSDIDGYYLPTVAASPYGIPYNASTSLKPILITACYPGDCAQTKANLPSVLSGGVSTLLKLWGIPSAQQDIGPALGAVRDLGAHYGWPIGIYEGAPQSMIVDPTYPSPVVPASGGPSDQAAFLAIVVAALDDPGIVALILQYFQWVADLGAEFFAYYNGPFGVGMRGSTAGSWPVASYLGQPLADAPMLQALRDYQANPAQYPPQPFPAPPTAATAFAITPATLAAGQAFSISASIATAQASDTTFTLTPSDPTQFGSWPSVLTIPAGQTTAGVPGSVTPRLASGSTVTITAQNSYAIATTTATLMTYTAPYQPNPADSRADASLIGAYPFYETSGDAIHDVSGHNNHLNILENPGSHLARVAGPTASGPGSSAWQPAGPLDGLSCDLAAPVSKAGLTLAVIFEVAAADPSAVGSFGAVADVSTPSEGYDSADKLVVHYIAQGAGNPVRLEALCYDPAGSVGANCPVGVGAYRQLVVTVDGANVAVYLDGAPATAAALPKPAAGTFSRVTLGHGLVSATASAAIKFAGFAVASRAWTAAEAAMPLASLVVPAVPVTPASPPVTLQVALTISGLPAGAVIGGVTVNGVAATLPGPATPKA